MNNTQDGVTVNTQSAQPPRDDVEARVSAVIARAMDCPVSDVSPSSSLEEDLGAQSLDFLDIAFSLEREFRIQFPRADFLQRASDHFGEENLMKDGVVTPFGLKLLALGMPEIDAERLKPGLRVTVYPHRAPAAREERGNGSCVPELQDRDE
jgi:acyl carrier protein